MSLTPKQQKFVEEYLRDLNATQAAIRAGYSEKTSDVQGSRLLSNVKVAAAISELRQKDSENCGISREKWLKELALCGFSDIAQYVDIDEFTGAVRSKAFADMPEHSSRVIKKVKEKRVIRESSDGDSTIMDNTFEFELYPKLQALELIGKHLGFFVEDKDEGSTETPGFNISRDA